MKRTFSIIKGSLGAVLAVGTYVAAVLCGLPLFLYRYVRHELGSGRYATAGDCVQQTEEIASEVVLTFSDLVSRVCTITKLTEDALNTELQEDAADHEADHLELLDMELRSQVHDYEEEEDDAIAWSPTKVRRA